MILILSEPNDAHIPLVTTELDKRDVDYVRFDPGWLPVRAQVEIHVSRAGQLDRFLTFANQRFDMESVSSVWYRRPTAPLPHEDCANSSVRDLIVATCQHCLDGIWDSIDRLWIPAKPSVDRLAHNKVKQLRLAGQLGFTVPRTMITNSPSAFTRFYDGANGQLISKPLIQRPVTHEREEIPVIYTRPVRRRDARRLQSIQRSPVIFQESVPKQVEIRATVVGTKVMAAAIHSQEYRVTLHDWRHYHDDRVRYTVHRLPVEVADRLVNLVSSLGLSFGAVDLILTPAGDYVFLEVNPNGQWGFMEVLAGLPIASAIADLLTAE